MILSSQLWKKDRDENLVKTFTSRDENCTGDGRNWRREKKRQDESWKLAERKRERERERVTHPAFPLASVVLNHPFRFVKLATHSRTREWARELSNPIFRRVTYFTGGFPSLLPRGGEKEKKKREREREREKKKNPLTELCLGFHLYR